MTSMKQLAYENIKNKIINCEIKPGAPVEEKELIAEMSISRTPIREALWQLAIENLVEIVPRRGIFVTQITLESVKSLFQYREVLEPFIARVAMPGIPENTLRFYHKYFSDVKNGIVEENQHEYAIQDDAFHRMIASYCNNMYAMSAYQTLYNHSYRIRVMSNVGRRIDTSVAEHIEILECMLKQDEEGAVEAMRKHMVSAREQAYKMLEL